MADLAKLLIVGVCCFVVVTGCGGDGEETDAGNQSVDASPDPDISSDAALDTLSPDTLSAGDSGEPDGVVEDVGLIF